MKISNKRVRTTILRPFSKTGKLLGKIGYLS